MKLGITGTREGTSVEAMYTLRAVLQAIHPTELHHGDCVGADAEAHLSCRSLSEDTIIVIHPPFDDTFRAYLKADELREEEDYLTRNHNIAKECDILIAMPESAKEVVRSGTWATVRRAIANSKPVMIIDPTGVITWR
jgi:hypothetical protein